MSKSEHRSLNPLRKKSYGGLLVLMIAGSFLIGSLIVADANSSPIAALAAPRTSEKVSVSSHSDPTATLNGFHLCNITKGMAITQGGTDLALSYPATWTPTTVGLNFFNGTLLKTTYPSFGTQTISVTTPTSTGYQGSIYASYVLSNSTIYQAQFNVTGMTVGEPANYTIANGLSNSSYPAIDGNVGIAQRFLISSHALNMTIEVRLMELQGTRSDLTVELRSSTTGGQVGGLIRTSSYANTSIVAGNTWVPFAFPNVNLSPGYYFIVLHTDGWATSGGGYFADTTLNETQTSPASGYVSFDRGVDWGNIVNLTSTEWYYFNGFELGVHVTPPPIPSDLNLRINGFQVSDNGIWNQSTWVTAPPAVFTVTSNYPIPVLNLTYEAWAYTYGINNLFRSHWRVVVNGYKNTTAIVTNASFPMMYVNLNQTDLTSQPGVIDNSTSTINLNLVLLSNNTATQGILNATAIVQLTKQISVPSVNPSSLKLAFDYTQLGGTYSNVTLAETAMSIGPINSQLEDVYINTNAPGSGALNRNLWSYNLETGFLFIYRDAFTKLPQFTLVNGSLLQFTATAFNNFTALVYPLVSMENGVNTTPIASLKVVNSTPLIDLDNVSQVSITVTAPNGTLINDTILTVIDSSYEFDWTLRSGAGIYGLEITSVSSTTGIATTRWIGNATVKDFTLSPPKIALENVDGTTLSGNITSGQRTLILADLSYIDHSDFTFNGTVSITIYLGSTGEVSQLMATWNTTTNAYTATYDSPSVDSPTFLTIRVDAVDIEGRTSTNSIFTYIVPHAGTTIPPTQPSLAGTLEILFVIVVLLIPVVAYIIEKRRITQ